MNHALHADVAILGGGLLIGIVLMMFINRKS